MTEQAPGGGSSGTAASRGKLRIAALGALAVVLTLVAVLFQARDYTRTDAKFCAGACHTPRDGAAFHTRGHDGVSCQSCHTTSDTAALELLRRKVLGTSGKPPRHSGVQPATCVSCHEEKPASFRLIQDTEGHRVHRAAKDVSCTSCHGADVHGTEPAGEKTCLSCHKTQRLHKTAKDAETCLSCHSFTATEGKAPAPTAVVCERCHADAAKVAASAPDGTHLPGKSIDPTVLHGRLDCRQCHDPHGHKPVIPEGQPTCVRCHQFQIFSAGLAQTAGPEGHKNCEGCHKPHAPLKNALQSCVKCHENNARGVTPVGPGKSTALQHESCASCHLPHAWRAERSGCMQCHQDKAATILNESPPQHGQCTNCHSVHGAPPSAQVCVGCHKNKLNHMAVAPTRHKDCTSCHNPHAANVAAARVSCANCHTNQNAGVAHGPEGHSKQTCFGCHKPHENPLPPADVCGRCHEKNARLVSTASPPKHRVCTSCHEKHQFAITDIASACARCHGPVVGAADAPHNGDCKGCHTLHGTPEVVRPRCLGCHEKIAAVFKPPPGNAPHDKCRSCHQPHRAASTAPTRCAGCHEKQAQVALTWPTQSAHAQACNKCHQPHDVRTKKACSECHAKEAESAVAAQGKHKCIQCHPPHQATPGNGVAWWKRCASCHDDKVQSVKAKGTTHSQCQNCHKPHGFSRPACSTCHAEADMAQKGVHAVKQHAAKCTACHDPHTKAEPNRAQCLACHTNKTAHEPGAERCQACHPFK
jgi:hypothetical protein